jgi:large subunit ribosomal protein L18
MDETIRDSEGDKTARARQAGKLLAERATAAGFASVIFDRGGYRYHGRVAAFADGAREGGLEF